MEDIIPLLIIIAISVIGAIGRKKDKRKNPNISAPQTRQQDDGIFDWLEKIADDRVEAEEEIPYAPNPVRDDNIYQKETSKTFEPEEKPANAYAAYSGFISPDEKEALMANEGVSTIKQRESTIFKPKNAVESSMKTSKKKQKRKHQRAFNLRQAVIYSEVLNRKYN
ncbi:MAG: hypothetical protein JXR50_07220 [Prolixibacteraceae bacterium]|nr:hypothetical protein [Prolixibacteraceae bacterium]